MDTIKRKAFWVMIFLSLNCLHNALGQETSFLEGIWTTAPSTDLAMQFFLNDGEVSAAMMIFSGNKCAIGIMQGTLGLATTKEWEGFYKVNSANKTLMLIDDFDDEEVYRYVLSETEEDMVLKLKSSDGEITTWSKANNCAS